MHKEHGWTSLNANHENTVQMLGPEHQYCRSHGSRLLCCLLMYLTTVTPKFLPNLKPEKTCMTMPKLAI